MPRIEVREGTLHDVPHLVAMDHQVETRRVWQLDWANDGRLGAVFRPMSLPRPVQLAYPYRPEVLQEEWDQRPGVLVALHQGVPVGYAAFAPSPDPEIAWLRDVVVDLPWRGQGIAKALLVMSLRWAALHACRQVVWPVSFRNDPAVCLARRMGFAFAGFRYAHFPNGDTALFFQRSSEA